MDRLSDVIDVAVRGLRDEIGVEEAVSRLNAIRRDLAAKSEVCEHGVRLGGKCARCCEDRPYGRDAACHCGHGSLDHNSVAGRKCCQPGCLCRRFRPAEPRDSDVDALRAQVADLTRERDSMVREAQRRGETIVEAVARAEKAERERDARDGDAREMRRLLDAEREAHQRTLAERDELRTTLAARDATIAEQAKRISAARWLLATAHITASLTPKEWPSKRDTWLAGQPAGAAEPHPEPHSCEAAEQAIESLEADLLEARAEVARLEGLRARSKAFLEWFYEAGIANDDGRALLADLRAGRAS